ncbi:MAG: hypothetical protein ACRDYU_16240, partial [Actinomycetes bacterium]
TSLVSPPGGTRDTSRRVERQWGMAQSPGSSSSIAQAALVRTRESWHRLAEHVVSPARYAVTGRIGLRPAPGGFRTPAFGEDHRVVAVDGDALVLTARGAPGRRAPIVTLRQAGAFVGIEPGAPADVYTPTTPLDLDEPMDIDQESARILAGWFALGAQALRRFADEISEDDPAEAQLWPEHFDLGITAGAVNYGASPGDEHVEVPYLYVGPHQPPPRGHPFFTQPFGAVRTMDETSSVDDTVAFFREGRRHALAIPPQRRPQ